MTRGELFGRTFTLHIDLIRCCSSQIIVVVKGRRASIAKTWVPPKGRRYMDVVDARQQAVRAGTPYRLLHVRVVGNDVLHLSETLAIATDLVREKKVEKRT